MTRNIKAIIKLHIRVLYFQKFIIILMFYVTTETIYQIVFHGRTLLDMLPEGG